MPTYLRLRVPVSCSEDWNNMLPRNNGRFCESCNKNVIDFTSMTDAELISYFKSHHGPTCGRFTKQQTQTDIRIPAARMPWMKYFVRVALPAFLLSVKSTIHAQKQTQPIVITPNKQIPATQQSITDTTQTIKGKVTSEDGIPLPGASVIINGTNRGAATDPNGDFVLSNVPPDATLTISSVGMETREVKASEFANGAVPLFTLNEQMLGEVVIVGAILPERRFNVKKRDSEQKSTNIKVYPNPVQPGTTITIQCRKVEPGNYSTEIYTISGQLVQSATCNYAKHDKQITIKVGQLTSGSYLVRLTNRGTGKTYSEGIVVNE